MGFFEIYPWKNWIDFKNEFDFRTTKNVPKSSLNLLGGGKFPPPNFGVRDIYRLFWSIGSIQNMLISHENFHRYVHSTKTDIFKNSWKKSHIDDFLTLKENSVKIEISKNALFWSKIFQKSDMCLKRCPRQGFSIPNNWFLIGDL